MSIAAQASSTSSAARRRLASMPSSCGIRRFAAVGVLGEPLADGRLAAGHVEQVVGDLKRQAEVAAVRRERGELSRRRAGDDAAQFAATPRSARRSCGDGSIPATAASSPVDAAGQVGGLAADQRGRTGGVAQHGAAAGGPVGRLDVGGQHFERPGQAARRRRGSPPPRRTPCGRSAGRGAGRRHPSPAGRRARANRRGPSRRHRRPAGQSSIVPPQASAASSTSCGRNRLPGAKQRVANRLGQVAAGSRRRTEL